MDLQPGQHVTITVTGNIDRLAARKTLARIFLKDPAIAGLRLKDNKPFGEKIQGGRWWRHTSGSAAVVPVKGQSAKVTATLDVIRDIQSVARFVDVK